MIVLACIVWIIVGFLLIENARRLEGMASLFNRDRDYTLIDLIVGLGFALSGPLILLITITSYFKDNGYIKRFFGRTLIKARPEDK